MVVPWFSVSRGKGRGGGASLGLVGGGFLKGRMQEKMNVRIVCKG